MIFRSPGKRSGGECGVHGGDERQHDASVTDDWRMYGRHAGIGGIKPPSERAGEQVSIVEEPSIRRAFEYACYLNGYLLFMGDSHFFRKIMLIISR